MMLDFDTMLDEEWDALEEVPREEVEGAWESCTWVSYDGEPLSDMGAEEAFDEWFDESVAEWPKIGAYEYAPSKVLKAVDPIAYRCEFVDWKSEYLRPLC